MARRQARFVIAATAGIALVAGLIGSPLASAATAPNSLKVNFETTTTATPAGYLADTGAAFTAARGYGWEDGGDAAPMDFSTNTRERGVNSNILMDTFMMPQLAGSTAGNHTWGQWEAVVANGSYQLTIGVGDPSYIDSHDVFNVEGVKVVDFTPTTATPQTIVTANVTVSDGRLTINSDGGTNSKIDYIALAAKAQTSPAALSISTPQSNLGLGARLVFSTVKNEARTGQKLTLSNTGGSALSVTGLTFSGTNAQDFGLCSGQATALSIPANSSATVCVQYRPTVDATTHGTQTSAATLNVAAGTGVATVSLGGLNTENYESYHEPNLQQITTALGFTDNVGVTNWPQKNSISAASTAVGDEVLSPYWKALNSAHAVQLIPVAHYSGQNANNTAPFGWYAKGSSTINNLYAEQGGANGANDGYGQNQLLVPAITSCSGCANSASFKPAGSFGLTDNYAGYASFSDDAKNSGGWHNYRFYPAKDASGKVIAGEYLVGDDVAGPVNNSAKNWDYQDFSFLLVNATPDTAAKQPAAGNIGVSLPFNRAAGGIDQTGFTKVQGTETASKLAISGGDLKVTTSNDSNTAHTNALEVPVNAGDKFIVQSQFVGPFTSINAGSEQQGIFFGPNATNYIKAEIEWNPTAKARYLTIWEEKSGTGKIIKSVKVPAGTINTLTYQIVVDSSTQLPASYNGDPIVTVNYSVNGGAYATLGTTTIPGAWITATTPAGIMTSYQGGAAFVASYAGFTVARDEN